MDATIAGNLQIAERVNRCPDNLRTRAAADGRPRCWRGTTASPIGGFLGRMSMVFAVFCGCSSSTQEASVTGMSFLVKDAAYFFVDNIVISTNREWWNVGIRISNFADVCSRTSDNAALSGDDAFIDIIVPSATAGSQRGVGVSGASVTYSAQFGSECHTYRETYPSSTSGTSAVTVATNTTASIYERATSGTVTLSDFNSESAAGSFDAVFASGERLSGTFSAPVCSTSYSGLTDNWGGCWQLCSTAADCTGLPSGCRKCPDGTDGCAFFTCVEGQCEVAYCP